MRWKLHKEAAPGLADTLMNELNINKAIALLLIQRNIKNYQAAKAFFRPSYEYLHNPFLMKDMDKAIERIKKAILHKEKILIYGDYDVDGTTAVALVYSFLKQEGALVHYYIPDRYAEGYGISFKGVDYANENNFTLIIALDCGIKAIDKVDYANAKNIDFIICDHHLPGEQLPQALAILDPKRKDCAYPFKELSGCGIGYKLAQAYLQATEQSEDILEEYIDLVAVSIAADIVPITDENRILAYFGLIKLNTLTRPGFRSIVDLNKIKKDLSINDLVFIIAPRINAAGRIEHGSKAVELLIADSMRKAEEVAKEINVSNVQRKDLDQAITAEAIEMIESSEHMKLRKSTVVYHESWHKGVVGIVASRLVDRFYRPTIVLTHSNGKITGSARSVKDFDVYEAIDACSELLEQYGGHKYAAGLTLNPENVNLFTEKFEAVVSSTITDELLIPELEVDLQIDFSDINDKFYRILKQFAPHGPGNMTPVFVTENVLDTGNAKIVGNNHLRMELCQASNPKIRFQAIAFDKGEYLTLVKKRIPFKICYSLQENEWNGNKSLQLFIRGINNL